MGFAVGAAARKLAKFYAAALAGQPVTPAQLYVLRLLWAEDGQALGGLGLRAGLDATSLTWTVDQLAKAGLVERRRGDPDRRVVRAWLTDAGRQLGRDLAPELRRWEAALADVLAAHHAADEVAAFRRVLATLTDRLPEGEDLWVGIASDWDARLASLKAVIEDERPEGGVGDGDRASGGAPDRA